MNTEQEKKYFELLRRRLKENQFSERLSAELSKLDITKLRHLCDVIMTNDDMLALILIDEERQKRK